MKTTMTKLYKTFIFAALLINNSSSFSQSWQPVSTGVSSSINNTTSLVRSMIVFNNKLIVGGSFDNAGGNPVNNIASWDGTNWESLDNGISSGNSGFSLIECNLETRVSGLVKAMAIFNNELYVGGVFNTASGVSANYIAKWNGSNWSSVGRGVRQSYYYSQINSMAVYNNELYVTGDFDSAGTVAAKNIAKWNGTSWSAVDRGIKGSSGHSLLVFNNKLYVGGSFDSAGVVAAKNVAVWNGSNWEAMGYGIPSTVRSLCVYNNKVHAGNSTTGVSFWNGTAWSSVGGGLSGAANALINYGSSGLVAAGEFTQAGNVPYVFFIALYDGSNWNHLTSPNLGASIGSGFQNMVRSICFYNGYLYAGGCFNNEIGYPSSNPLKKIARLSTSAGIADAASLNTFQLFPNPAEREVVFGEEFEKSEVTFTDVNGKKVLKTFINQTHLDISHLDAGIYTVTLFKNGKTYRSKMVKL